MKITVFVPQHPKTDRWKLTEGQSRKSFFSLGLLYRYLEHKINDTLASRQGVVIHLIVNYDSLHHSRSELSRTKKKNDRISENKCEWFNDITSSDKKELLYALTCFLEDYLSLSSASEKYQTYAPVTA